MCGIVGFWDARGADIRDLERMTAALEHRGPDDAGTFLSKCGNLALGHRRLSIIDLSPAGHQPMTSASGRWTLVYNGEIYNHLELRVEIERDGPGVRWRGHSDTETLLAAVECWGFERTLHKLNGMFAFALWDSAEDALFLARDRMGEKPLYYGRNNGVFFFGSELSGLTQHHLWKGEIDRQALTLYMRYCYVPSPWSVYKGILKLPPAHFVRISARGEKASEPRAYWSLAEAAETGIAAPRQPAEELVDELDALLRDAVSKRMLSDVPLGAFLSGGIDSTTMVALMQAQSDRRVKTFTVGFHEMGMNEAEHAKTVAGHLGTEHTEMYVSAKEALDVVPSLPGIWDEPFADSSQVPTLLVSQLVRKHVTVSLSGDGGDELFCGYNRYAKGYQMWKRLSGLPGPLRSVLAAALNAASRAPLERMQNMLPARTRVPHLSGSLAKLAMAIEETSGHAYYRRLVSQWENPADIVVSGVEPQTPFDDDRHLPDLPGLREQMMYVDTLTYLPDDILTKVDRASMATSLEARVPLLDHRVVEFAWKVPTDLKYRDGLSKWILREVLYRYVPRQIMERPKMGFGAPIGQWLRGPLRDWAEVLLDERRLREEGYLQPARIRAMWSDHIAGKGNWQYHLWTVLMFQAWLESCEGGNVVPGSS